MLNKIGVLALAVLAASAGYLAYQKVYEKGGSYGYKDEEKPKAEINWVAAAPGRVEPKSGEIRLGVSMLGTVEKVLVKVDDEVEEGELLVRLDDAEAIARLTSAETQAEALREEREKQFASGREDLRKAEDAFYSAERAATGARIALDEALEQKRSGKSNDSAVSSARRNLKDAQDRVERERQGFTKALLKPNLPPPNSAESAVSAARTDVRLAEALLEKTRVRAPQKGTILQLNVKNGEIVAPSPEQALIVMGDVSSVTVKAEIDEGDVAKVKVGQKAFVKSVAHPGKEFEGTVARLAPTLGQARILPRGPRRTNDVEVLEVTIDMTGDVPLLTGMRVDAFFRKDGS